MAESSPPTAPGAPPPALVSALRRILRPLIRLLLARQITYPYLSNLLKSVYVEVAERDFPVPGRPQTDSRVSLLTGVHRKDVKRLRQSAPDQEAPPANVSLGAQLVARWTGIPDFLDPDGNPRPLPRQPTPGGYSFEELVESVSKDIRARAVLDEWLRLGIAHVDEQDRVWLNTAAFVPGKGFDEKAYYFGRNLRDHIAAGAHNLSGSGPPFLERSVYYDELAPASVAELARLAENLGMQALQAVNRRALALQKRDQTEPDATRRMNFGIYFFSADVAEEESSPDDQ